jgi:hypothetical protein
MAQEQWGYLVSFRLRGKLPPAARTKFYREFYGYDDRSQYGRYRYQRPGLLDELGYVAIARGVVVVSRSALLRVMAYLKPRAEVEVRRVALTAGDGQRLQERAIVEKGGRPDEV